MALQRGVYRPRDAEHAVLHQVIAEHLEAFLRAVAEAGDGAGLPQFVEREFRESLTCGVFEHGVARFRCEGCARAPGTVLVQRTGVVSQLWWSPDDGARRASGGRGAAVGVGHDRKGKEVSFRRPLRTIFPSDSRSLSTCLTVLFLSPSEKYDVAHLSLCFVRSSPYHPDAVRRGELGSHRASQRGGVKT